MPTPHTVTAPPFYRDAQPGSIRRALLRRAYWTRPTER
jgi:hypothetical protein